MIATDVGRDPASGMRLPPNSACWAPPLARSMAVWAAELWKWAPPMEEFGKVIAIEPYLQTVVIGGGALKAVGGAQAAAHIPGIISGESIIAFAYAEPQGRYDLANIRTTAKADGGGYILNGHKGVVYCAPWRNTSARHRTHRRIDPRTQRRRTVPDRRQPARHHPPRLSDLLTGPCVPNPLKMSRSPAMPLAGGST